MNSFRENIAYLRKNRGWSQEDLARKLDVQRTTISNYEKGVSMPPYKTLKKLADIFNTDITQLTTSPLVGYRFDSLLESEDLLFSQISLKKPKESPDTLLMLLTKKLKKKEPIIPVILSRESKHNLHGAVRNFHKKEKVEFRQDRKQEIELLEKEIARMKSSLHNLENLLERLKKGPDFQNQPFSTEEEKAD